MEQLAHLKIICRQESVWIHCGELFKQLNKIDPSINYSSGDLVQLIYFDSFKSFGQLFERSFLGGFFNSSTRFVVIYVMIFDSIQSFKNERKMFKTC